MRNEQKKVSVYQAYNVKVTLLQNQDKIVLFHPDLRMTSKSEQPLSASGRQNLLHHLATDLDGPDWDGPDEEVFLLLPIESLPGLLLSGIETLSEVLNLNDENLIRELENLAF